MIYEYTPRPSSEKEKKLQRFFEILPGLLSWTILIGMMILSIVKPVISAIIIIAFDSYWLLRLFYMTLFLVISYYRLSLDDKTDWMVRIREIDRDAFREGTAEPLGFFDWNRKLSLWLHRRKLDVLRKSADKPPLSEEILHLVIISIVKEKMEIVEPGISSLASGEFPAGRMIVVLAVEERAAEQIKEDARAIHKKYRGTFFDMKMIEHPEHLPGEAAVKGANITYAAREMAAYFKIKKIPVSNVIVSVFDADTVVGPKYFSCLTYHFMCSPARTRTSFQPIPVYSNNIWDVPGFARVLETGSSFFQMIEATNPEKLVTFSSHSMSFKALVDVDYWPCDMISDDSAIFWKSYIHFDGDYRVVPLPVTLSMDVVDSGKWWKTMRSVYRQKRRWAWGVENFPVLMRAFMKAKKISFFDRFRHTFKMMETHIAWATWPFLLTVMSWLPAIFASREFSQTVLYYSASRITAIIFRLSFLAILVTVILSLMLLPKKKVKFHLLKRLIFALQWLLLLPFIYTLLSALPALDAQTRLMLKKYMEFWVSDKKRRHR